VSVIEALGRCPRCRTCSSRPPEGSTALLVRSLFALTGIVVALALIRVDKSQVEEAAAAPPVA
jgi:hypothetical protein